MSYDRKATTNPESDAGARIGRNLRLALVAGAVAIATALPLQAQEPIKIGMLLSTSGVFAALSEDTIRGARMAIEDAGGQVAGRKIELVIEDDEAKPAVGVSKARKMVQSDKIDVLTGLVSSAVAVAILPYTIQNKLPVVVAMAGANSITGETCSPWVYRLSYSSWQVASPLGTWLAKSGKKKVFVIASDYVSPREMFAGFKETFVKAGGTIVGEAWAPFAQTQDYGPYLAQAKAANPDAIYSVFYGGEAILFVKQYDAFGMKTIPLTGPLGITADLVRNAQGDAAADVTSSVNYFAELDTPENNAFRAKFQQKYQRTTSEFSALGYDSLRFIIEALKKTDGKTADRDAVRKAMSGVSFVGPRGPLRIDPQTNHVIQNVYIVKTVKKDGKVVAEAVETIKDVATPTFGCKMQ